MKPGKHYHAVEAIDLFDFRAKLKPAQVLETLAKAGFPRNDGTRRRIDTLLPSGNRLIDPKGVARIHAMASLTADQRVNLPNPIQEAEYLLFALATAGECVDKEASRLRGLGDLINSMVIDSMALAALNQVTLNLTTAAREWAAQRQFGSSRAFSPGSGGNEWGLSSQGFLFTWLPADAIGVQLTPSFLMLPTKSVSFVLGMGSKIDNIDDPFSCSGCPRIDCAYRNEPQEEMISSAEMS